ncbi:MAG: tRNA (adenosine(37)-N6)-threonylcarbamoyltransferase complex ATPase subunit type 1 TsaE [Proteobacteria bacterium]|nr:tRNA (adenosine(37)-N6)-threonylcarbamoyltransferase complex ATPase subunit type 1 TsaE [Pseudomonadota bacterium]
MHTSQEPNKFSQDDNASTLFLPDEATSLALGGSLAPWLAPGMVVFLEGDLGAGKTTLVRGLLRALGYENKVKSPTYTLVELYVVSGLNLYHFDFYRFNQQEEYLDAGLDEYFQGTAVCLVEWPDNAGVYLPPADLSVHLSLDQDGRLARLSAGSEKGRLCLTNWRTAANHILGAKFSSSPPPR